MRKRKSSLVLFMIIIIFSCTDIGEVTRNYTIINDTDEYVLLKFYNYSSSGIPSLNYSIERDGKGLVIERILTVGQRDEKSAMLAFEADSIALIFNNNKIQGFTNGLPLNISILSTGSYTRIGNDFTYRITEEIYNNAIPCDGACN